MNKTDAQELLNYIRAHHLEYEAVSVRLEKCRQTIQWANQQRMWDFIADLTSVLSYHFLYSSPAVAEEVNTQQAYEMLKAFWHQGKEFAIQGLQAAKKTGNRHRQMDLLEKLTRLSVFSEDFDTAMSSIKQMIWLVDPDAKWGVAYEAYKMGQRACQTGHPSAGRDLFEISLGLLQELDNKWGVATVLFFLGQTELATGNSSAAKARFVEALSITDGLKGVVRASSIDLLRSHLQEALASIGSQ